MSVAAAAPSPMTVVASTSVPSPSPPSTSAASAAVAVVKTASTSASTDSNGFPLEFDPSLSEDERRFYIKAYPTIDMVRERKVHCTTCKVHIGTAPAQEPLIKMHPVLRVTHCSKCHDFYNSGEFSKGEDGSELYCRWCGQGGEVYCCSNCPYVFCKSCITKNLSRGVVADIEQNENWSCFSCSPKILWPLRGLHWALINYIEKQKKQIKATKASEEEFIKLMAVDRSTCCRLAKAKCGNMSDSMDSIDSITSRRSQGSSSSSVKKVTHKLSMSPSQMPAAKRKKTANDEVVCTPDLLSMLEPDCQITVPAKPRPVQAPPATAASSPRIMSITPGYGLQMSSTPRGNAPPPLVLRNTSVQVRPIGPSPIMRRTVVGPRTPNPASQHAPVYHTINGYRIDLNTAAQQETFRLPNGKLIQVKRQGANTPANANANSGVWQQRPGTSVRPVQITHTQSSSNNATVTVTGHPQLQTITIQQPIAPAQHLPQQHPQMVRYHNTMVGNTTVTPIGQNATQIQVVNGAATATALPVQAAAAANAAPVRQIMVRHTFPDTAIGQARTQLQDQVFGAMEICQHLTGKLHTLTNSNAYKQARNYLEVKELYIHLSYLLTYAIGRYKGLQDRCLGDMRQLGFVNDADSLENGQLAADKQASDDEDNEIEIVEPKTDTITLDSDNEEESTAPIKMKADSPAKVTTLARSVVTVNPVSSPAASADSNEDVDFLVAAQTFLAGMLEVDLSEGTQAIMVSQGSPSGNSDTVQKKQPRKKTTNKPNPTLLKQKEMLQRERLEEMKRSDQKLKMRCAIQLKKVEEEYPFAKELIRKRLLEKQQQKDQKKDSKVKEAEEMLENVDNTADEEKDAVDLIELNSSFDEELSELGDGEKANDKETKEKHKDSDTEKIKKHKVVEVSRDVDIKSKESSDAKESKVANEKDAAAENGAVDDSEGSKVVEKDAAEKQNSEKDAKDTAKLDKDNEEDENAVVNDIKQSKVTENSAAEKKHSKKDAEISEELNEDNEEEKSAEKVMEKPEVVEVENAIEKRNEEDTKKPEVVVSETRQDDEKNASKFKIDQNTIENEQKEKSSVVDDPDLKIESKAKKNNGSTTSATDEIMDTEEVSEKNIDEVRLKQPDEEPKSDTILHNEDADREMEVDEVASVVDAEAETKKGGNGETKTGRKSMESTEAVEKGCVTVEKSADVAVNKIVEEDTEEPIDETKTSSVQENLGEKSLPDVEINVGDDDEDINVNAEKRAKKVTQLIIEKP